MGFIPPEKSLRTSLPYICLCSGRGRVGKAKSAKFFYVGELEMNEFPTRCKLFILLVLGYG
jgi:hypothetical protein